ncbi:MAG: hypothetical protein ACRDTR_19075 [Rubrobacter sp.]
MREGDRLPEVISLSDARSERPVNAAGIGEFWYEPEVWSLPLSPTARVLYAGLCSFLGHREINRKDLRNTLKGSSDTEIAEALVELAYHGLLETTGHTRESPTGYAVYPIGSFRA